jgi:hypothetical protein
MIYDIKSLIKLLILIIILIIFFINPIEGENINYQIENKKTISKPIEKTKTISKSIENKQIISIPIISKSIENKPIIYKPIETNNNENINSKVKCCLIEKKFIQTYSNPSGDFKYIYNKLYDDKCNPNLYNIDNNKQLFIEGVNDWSNNNCKDNKYIGSCRNMNKECVDFVSKEYCDHYKLVWNENTCQFNIPYKWDDKEKRVIAEKKIDDKFQLF